MVKKLNKYRALRGSMVMSTKWYEKTSEYTKIFLQIADVRIMLNELKSRLELSSLRLKIAIRLHDSKQKRAELKFQQRILNEHLNQIDKLLARNHNLQKWAYEKEYGESYFDYDSFN